jgi:hypothetical protein
MRGGAWPCAGKELVGEFSPPAKACHNNPSVRPFRSIYGGAFCVLPYDNNFRRVRAESYFPRIVWDRFGIDPA